MEYLPKIFDLAAQRQINPSILRTFPLLEARAALATLASGAVTGKLVLVA